MRDESEIRLKRAYWAGVFYGLDPDEKHKPGRQQRHWLTAEVWLTALDWALGQATDPATSFLPMSGMPDTTSRWEDLDKMPVRRPPAA